MPSRDPTKLVQLKARMREPLRAQLEKAAEQRGVSINAEMVDRLERSFDRERSLPEMLALKFGPRLAALLMMVGETARVTGLIIGSETIDSETRTEPSFGHDEWTDHHHAYDYAAKAANMVWMSARPDGETPPLSDATRKRIDDLVSKLVRTTINGIRNPEKARNWRDAPMLHKLAGPIAERMAFPPKTEDGGDNAR